MLFKRSAERFDPLEYSRPLTEEQMQDVGVSDYTTPKVKKRVDGIYVVENSFKMADGWDYKAASTVLPPDRIVTPVAVNMTGGWFTDYNDGFNLRRLAAIAKIGMEGTSVSVPTNNNRWWGDLEANAYNQARIHKAMAMMLGRHSLKGDGGFPVGRLPEFSTVDGLSRGAMHGEAVAGVSPELGTDVLFAYYTVACRINGVEEVEDIAEIVRQFAPKNLARIAMRGEIPDELMLAHIIKTARKTGKAIGETFGNEIAPFKEMIATPLARLREGESLLDAFGDSIGKFHPDSIVVPYQILSRYPNTLDLKHLHRQIAEAYTLTNGTYGTVAEKNSPDQFQVHSGFMGDGLSRFEEIIAAHEHGTHPHTIVEALAGGNHVSSIIEREYANWKKRWATVITALGGIGISELKSMTPSERAEMLHAKSAEMNPFFADENHPHRPTTPTRPGDHGHLHAA